MAAPTLYTMSAIDAGHIYIEESDLPVSAKDLKALGAETVAQLIEVGALSETPKYATVDSMISRDLEITRLRAALDEAGIDPDVVDDETVDDEAPKA